MVFIYLQTPLQSYFLPKHDTASDSLPSVSSAHVKQVFAFKLHTEYLYNHSYALYDWSNKELYNTMQQREILQKCLTYKGLKSDTWSAYRNSQEIKIDL